MADKDTSHHADEELLICSLRARDWDEFHGQDLIKKSLRIAIKAALERGEPLDHVLFYGPPGLGKTTLAHLISKELDSSIKITSGTALAKAGDLAAILTNLKDKDVLFIDEIHRLPKVVEETLYPAMEDYALDIVIGKGPSARTVRLDLPKITIVGATTRFGLLAGPFRDRFGIVQRFNFYKPQELVHILIKAAQKLEVDLDEKAALALAKRSRGTPRIALKLLKRVRDFAQVNTRSEVSVDIITQALEMLSIDKLGLDQNERNFLQRIINKHNGGPIGLKTIAATIHEDPGTIEEVLEPYLLQLGFIKRTAQGRVITKQAYLYLNKKYPESNS